MMRLVTLALVAVLVAAVWFTLAALWFAQHRRAKVRQMVREEIAATDAEWDQHVTESMALAAPLDPIFGPAADRMAERLNAELNDPQAVASWLWTEGRA